MGSTFRDFLIRYKTQLSFAVKLILLAVVVGVIVGFLGVGFGKCLTGVIAFRESHYYVILLLPLCGIGIRGMYHLFRYDRDGGTNLVLSAIQQDEHVKLRMVPSIFFGTIATQLVGGSAGREGAALQIGGSIGGAVGEVFRLRQEDVKLMIMCGMSAAFAVLFGTPIAAAVFAIEVVSIGIMHYNALVPCVIAAFIARGIGELFGMTATHFDIGPVPEFRIEPAVVVGILAVICAIVSMTFCNLLQFVQKLYKKYIRNEYLRAFAGGCIILVLTLLAGSQMYNGPGMDIVQVCLTTGTVFPAAFAVKMVFTALTLGCGGFKGGEIIPTFFIGATLGCFFGSVTGFEPSLCVACGMGALFCGVTNCPITSLLICFELFGGEGMPYYLIAIAISYIFSGYYGIYQSQKIMYSKFRAKYINRNANE